jgi:hypothetical protein
MQPKVKLVSLEFAQGRGAAKPCRTSGHTTDRRDSSSASELERRSIDGGVFTEVVDNDRNLLLHARCSKIIGAWRRP